MLHHIQNAFNAGELTPYTGARPELEVYQAGCRSMKNFIAIPYGGARYRPGTEFIGSTYEGGKVCLYGFEFSTSERHILEFGEGFIRFYQTGLDSRGIIAVNDEPYTLVTPYGVDDLRNLQFAQLNDIVIIVHPDHPPYRLSRYSLADWVMEPYPFSSYPYLEPETDPEAYITSSEVIGVTTLNTGQFFFLPEHVGTVLELAYRRTDEEITQELTIEAGTTSLEVKDARTGGVNTRSNLNLSDPIRVEGDVLIQTFGTWTAKVELFRRYLGEDTWEEFIPFTGDEDRNVNEVYTIDSAAEVMVGVSEFSPPSNSSINPGRAVISVTDPFIRGRVEVTGYTSSTEATGQILVDVAEGKSTEWSESAFSPIRGYPRSVTFHGQRLWFGGTSSRPQTLWASRIDAYDDFSSPFAVDSASDDDAPLALTVFAEQHNRIEWLSSNRSLLAGTSAGEFVITGQSSEESVTPGNYNIRRHTSNGASSFQALPVDQAVIFIQRQGRRLRKMGYKFENDAYAADDVTIYSEHLTRGNLVELAFQRQRDPVIWGITDDGNLIGWTYRADQPFFAAYQIQSLGVTYESIAVTYGDGDEDELWVVVNRDGQRYIERFRPDQILAQEKGELGKAWFLDSAIEYTGTTPICAGLDHLEGLEVHVFVDDAFNGTATVENGQILNPRPEAERTLVGIHYGGELETMPIEVGTENGTSQGRTKQAGRAVIRLFQSLTGEWFTSQSDQARRFDSLSPQQSIVESRPLQNYNIITESHPGATRELTIGVRQTHPYPMTVLSVLARMTLTEDA